VSSIKAEIEETQKDEKGKPCAGEDKARDNRRLRHTDREHAAAVKHGREREATMTGNGKQEYQANRFFLNALRGLSDEKLKGTLESEKCDTLYFLKTMLILFAAGGYIMFDKFMKHVISQWFLYLTILFLLVLLAQKGVKVTEAQATAAEKTVGVEIAGKGNVPETNRTASPAPGIAVASEFSDRCDAGCPSRCAEPGIGSPLKSRQWQFAEDVGVYYLELRSGWLVSMAAPGPGAYIKYVPNMLFPRKFRSERLCEIAGGEEPRNEKFPNKWFGCGGSTGPDGLKLNPRNFPVPETEALLRFGFGCGQVSEAGSGGEVEKQPEKGTDGPVVPEAPGVSAAPRSTESLLGVGFDCGRGESWGGADAKDSKVTDTPDQQ
jgi:hypothetical protein